MKLLKSDLVLPNLNAPIKVGSKVVFTDGSYTLSIIDGKLESTLLGLSDEVFTVVAINVPCPTAEDYIDSLLVANNCIVIDDNKNIHFCSRINIQNIKELGYGNPKYVLKY